MEDDPLKVGSDVTLHHGCACASIRNNQTGRHSRALSQRAAAVSQSSQWPLAAAEQGGGRYSSLVHRSPRPYGGGERAWQAAMQCGK